MKKLIFIFIFSLLLITPCSAAPYDEASLQDSLPDYARNLAGEATQPASEGLERIESAFTETLSGGLSGDKALPEHNRRCRNMRRTHCVLR